MRSEGQLLVLVASGARREPHHAGFHLPVIQPHLDQSGGSIPIWLSTADIALEEILSSGGSLNRTLLGAGLFESDCR